MKILTANGRAKWPSLPCWEGCQAPVEGEPWELDASRLTWIEPTGMVTLAVKAMRTGTVPQAIQVTPGDLSAYVQRMGLYRILGLSDPMEMEHHPPGSRFTELRLLQQGMSPTEANGLCSEIAHVMAQGNPQVEDLFAYVLGELTANVRQHAGHPGVVMAQSWPKEHSVEFAIGDWGKGIREGLAENPRFRGIDDREALDVAIRPNTSGKDWAGAPGYGTRENSGNGLFTLSFLAREAPGRFLLASGEAALYIKGSQSTAKPLQCPFPGTLVSLKFNPAGLNVSVLLQEAAKARGMAIQSNDLIFE